MAFSECSIIWMLMTARRLWITRSSSLMLVSLINDLEQVHIKELPNLWPFMTGIYHLSGHHSPFKYKHCFCCLHGGLHKALPIWKTNCNDPRIWNAVYVHWSWRCDPSEARNVCTQWEHSMWHWLRCLGVLRPSIIRKQRGRQNNWTGSCAREAGKIFFFFLHQNNVFPSRTFFR